MTLPIQVNFNVFFSWQSDVSDMHSLIGKLLKKAAENVSKQIGIIVNVDEATRNVPGSPDIIQSLICKISSCDIFVADITPISTITKEVSGQEDIKLIPNPNVMFELGFAVALKGWDNIILLRKKDDSNSKDLPFDINHNRTDILNVDKSKDLTDHLSLPINNIIKSQHNEYPNFFSSDRLEINLRSEKYIPEIYVDNYDYRQHIRLFADPFSFYPKEIEELKRLNFDVLNSKYGFSDKEKFHFDIKEFPTDVKSFSFEKALDIFKSLYTHLNQNIEFLSKDANAGYINSSKIRHRKERIEYLINRILMVRAVAGQGKTNLICDLVNNILLKRKIPFLWLNGYEIEPTNFESSFLHKALQDRYQSLQSAIERIGVLCYRTHKPLIIIIDGLNEIPYNSRICDNLNQFLITLLKYDFVRIIVSCREEYYKEFFGKYLLDDCTIVYNRLNDISHDRDKRQNLLEAYCEHFGIELTCNENDEEYLTHNMLFLRIFCDVNKGKQIKNVDRRKYPLFDSYYSNSINNIASFVNASTGNSISKYDVQTFYDTIIKLMISENKFYNIPIKQIRDSLDPRLQGVFERFLDENILVKRDISDSKEVVSFTYDEFRDFLIARYLVNEVLPGSEDEFVSLAEKNSRSTVKEGILPFVLSEIYESRNENAKVIIKSRPWFQSVFAINIWNISEDKLKNEDAEYLLSCIGKFPLRITHELINRWNSKIHPILNISILLKYLYTLNDEEMAGYINTVFPISERKNSVYYDDPTFRDSFLEDLNELISVKRTELNEFKSLYELALILTIDSSMALKLVSNYIEDTNDSSIVHKMIDNTKCNKLKNILKQWK